MSTTLNTPDHSANRFFIVAVTVSLAVHVLAIFGVSFTPPDPRTLFNRAQLDVVLVNARSKTPPPKADVLAQADLDGGGNTDAPNRRISTPLPAEEIANVSEQLIKQNQRQENLEAHQARLMTDLQQAPKLRPDEVRPKPSESANGDNTEQLRQQASEIARLEGEISRDFQAYQTRPRRAFVAGRAKSVSEARYVDEWRIRIERVGNSNFPSGGNGQRLYGMLQLTVEIHANGTLMNVTIDRSSGNKELDEAAKRIVKLAAPFAPLPVGILDGTGKPADILSITRAWTFSRGENNLNSVR